MNCPFCLEEIQPGALKCKHCKTDLQDPFGETKARNANDAGLDLIIPVRVSFWPLIAGYAGIFCLIIFPAPFALLISLYALHDLKKNPKKQGKGRAYFGLAMGILGTLVLLTIALASLIGGK